MKKLIIPILLMNTLIVFPQGEKGTSRSYWFDAGVGGDNNGISCQTSLGILDAHLFYKVRFIHSYELALLTFTEPDETMNDFGFLAGRAFTKNNMLFTLSGGIGIISGTKRGEYLYSEGEFLSTSYYKDKSIMGMGIPLEMECIFRTAKHAGIGLCVYANLNREWLLYGMQCNIQLGKMH